MMRSLLMIAMLAIGALPAAQTPALAMPEDTIASGLRALVRLQQEDGSIGRGAGITALAGMALISGGHLPTRGALREASARALEYVLRSQDPISGYLGGEYGYMYAHGFATLYLAEVYGMTSDRRVRAGLEAALDLIAGAQNREGGWRYDYVPDDADISVTICQIMAIRAAYNVGVGGERSQQMIARALAYVRRCAQPSGGFSYMPETASHSVDEGPSGVPRAAAGVMCLIGAGTGEAGDQVLLRRGLSFLHRHGPNHLRDGGQWFWYAQYYAAQAMFHSPDEGDWVLWWNQVVPRLSELQQNDGLWDRPDSHGAAFATAVALIVLQIPNQYLPIFQR